MVMDGEDIQGSLRVSICCLACSSEVPEIMIPVEEDILDPVSERQDVFRCVKCGNRVRVTLELASLEEIFGDDEGEPI